jgi:hypothetical protein
MRYIERWPEALLGNTSRELTIASRNPPHFISSNSLLSPVAGVPPQKNVCMKLLQRKLPTSHATNRPETWKFNGARWFITRDWGQLHVAREIWSEEAAPWQCS